MSVLASQAGAQGEPHVSTVEESATVQALKVYKEVCHRIRNSLISGRNEIVSPTTISKTLVLENLQKHEMNGEAPSAESPGGAMEHTAVEDETCPFIEQAEGWSIEYSGGGCEVSNGQWWWGGVLGLGASAGCGV